MILILLMLFYYLCITRRQSYNIYILPFLNKTYGLIFKIQIKMLLKYILYILFFIMFFDIYDNRALKLAHMTRQTNNTYFQRYLNPSRCWKFNVDVLFISSSDNDT